MKSICIFLLIFIFNCKGKEPQDLEFMGEVSESQGLKIREMESVDSNQIGYLDYKSKVYILDLNGKKDFLHNRSGNWVKIKTLDSKEGWVFGAFLKISRKNDEKIVLSSTQEAAAKELYEYNCATCHGELGKGDGPAGGVFNPKPRNFSAPKEEWKNGKTSEIIFKTIKEGLPGSPMVSYAYLGDENLELISKYVYLLGLQ